MTKSWDGTSGYGTDPVMARSPDRDIGPTVGLPISDTTRETFVQRGGTVRRPCHNGAVGLEARLTLLLSRFQPFQEGVTEHSLLATEAAVFQTGFARFAKPYFGAAEAFVECSERIEDARLDFSRLRDVAVSPFGRGRRLMFSG